MPSKNVPVVVERITERFVKERQGNESFQDFITRIGKAESRRMLEDLMEVPAYEKDAAFYSDWGDQREFPMEFFAVQAELEIPALDLRVSGRIAQQLIAPAVPQHDASTAVFAFGNVAFEISVIERVILYVHGQMFRERLQARTLGNGPGF